MRTLRLRLALSALLAGSALQAAPTPRPPKLAVLLVVDQLRADYIDRFKADWTGGLARLVTRGAWLQNVAYPYLTTVTCAGHATVSTGAFPHTHGIIQNAWWSRTDSKLVTCTEDPHSRDIGYGPPVRAGDSAFELEIPTFSDEMRRQARAHVVSVSLKDRAAIMLAGHAAEAVSWLNNNLDGWATSSAFTSAQVPAVRAFVEANPIDADLGRSWDRLLPLARYQAPDDGVGEAPPKGWTNTFPHVLGGASGAAPDQAYHAQWEASPYADAYLGRLAAALVERMRLGEHDGTDVLAVSFSSTDLVGHAFGPDSQEIQDLLAHLDRTIGTLFDRLDALVGRDRWVVGLTGDHGVTPIPEQLVAAGKDAGRIDMLAMAAAAEKRLEAALGPGHYVNRLNGNDLYFEPGVYERLQSAPETLAAVLAGLRAERGIQQVFTSEQVRDGASATDPLLRAAALGYFAGRSGDLVIAGKPGWILSMGLGTTHGSASADDQRVPILLMGPGVRHGTYEQPATPADVAPTLAVLSGAAMPRAEGRVLREALIDASIPRQPAGWPPAGR